MWFGSRVVIVEPAVAFAQPHGTDEKKMLKRLFRREVSQLYPLRHPHVIKLYGACHRGDNPFLVMEHAQSGTLRSFVGNHKHRKWAVLHEVALGVQYLHERGIVHRRLMGDNIYIGDDGLVKLSAFGAYSMAFGNEATLEWRAPEVLRKMKATVASDIYALGMCIIEAVTGKSPYATEVAEKQDVKELVAYGVPPTKSVAFSTLEWEFVLQMICFRPHKRPKISDVVRELAALARDETQEAKRTAIDPVTKCDMEALFTVARSHICVNSDEAAASARDMETRSETPQHQVFDRLYDAWQASKNLPPSHLPLVLPRLQDLITRFTKDVEAQANGGLAASFAAQRQHADRVFSFQNEIDRLLEQHSELLRTTTQPTHAWRTQWYAHRHAQLRALGAVLERVDSLDVETCTCLLNELTKRRDAYTSIPPRAVHAACVKMRSMRGVRVPDWFVPHYEVAFDAFQSFSRGSFGSVHHGEWMGARVVIKKVFSADDDNDDDEVTTEFQKEVEIWSRLYHPHVLQLLGACHVGQNFLLSEFAARGQLDRYLRGLDPLRRMHEVWRTLHEAALGLQYLHSRGVVHCDLKCNNSLVGQDGKAKLSDYGLSRQQPVQPELASDSHPSKASIDAKPSTRVGAPRWKAPEVLNGAEPTMASDVYSFGMCIVEAVSGEYPWGPRDRDELVSDHVRQGGALFSKPRGFSEAQWALVVGACRFDPTERLPLSEIVAQLQVFANDADSATERAGDACSKLDGVAESEPDVMTAWRESGAFSLATRPVAAAMSDGERANARDTSYTESWETCAP
jgi:serine/threonine protein kinase